MAASWPPHVDDDVDDGADAMSEITPESASSPEGQDEAVEAPAMPPWPKFLAPPPKANRAPTTPPGPPPGWKPPSTATSMMEARGPMPPACPPPEWLLQGFSSSSPRAQALATQEASATAAAIPAAAAAPPPLPPPPPPPQGRPWRRSSEPASKMPRLGSKMEEVASASTDFRQPDVAPEQCAALNQGHLDLPDQEQSVATNTEAVGDPAGAGYGRVTEAWRPGVNSGRPRYGDRGGRHREYYTAMYIAKGKGKMKEFIAEHGQPPSSKGKGDRAQA